MKTSTDPRHKTRLAKIRSLFAYSFKTKPSKNIAFILSSLPKIDTIISSAAPEWPLDNINRVDLAILRMATYELLFDPQLPPKVAIDEAVEIAKAYGSDHSSSFVNGVLGNIFTNKDKKHVI